MTPFHLLLCLLVSASAYSKGLREKNCKHGACSAQWEEKEGRERVLGALNKENLAFLSDVKASLFSSTNNFTSKYEYSNGNTGDYLQTIQTTVESLGDSRYKGTSTYIVQIEGTYGEPYAQASHLSITSDYTFGGDFIFWQQVGEGTFYLKDDKGQYYEAGNITATGSGYCRTTSETASMTMMENTQVIDLGKYSSVSKSVSSTTSEVGSNGLKVSGTETTTTQTGSYSSLVASLLTETTPYPMQDGPYEVEATGSMQDPSGLASMKSTGSGYVSYSKESFDVKEWINYYTALSFRNFRHVF
ncbi:uncharacterized protein [Palaemon carinicauda]|uniref:uncharacterized protein n=1 Tax=Palaemon carinicauda TaxID=392227 RepID=UPI0035B66A9D